MGSVRVFWLDQTGLIEELRSVAGRIGEGDKNVVRIVLFGSLAEGRAVPGSDADILVILERDDRPFMDRISDWAARFEIDFPVEVFPYTVEELDIPIVREAERRGIVLYERRTRF